MKKLFSLFFALILLLSLALSVSAGAENSVTYAGQAEKFIFAPGSKKSPTDLFSELKGLMPGDTATEKILIRNAASEDVKIKIFIRSKGAQESTENFLKQLTMKIETDESKQIFKAAAHETADLTEWTELGTLYSGGKITLKLTVEVPITLGNEYQNTDGIIDWEFMVEEYPVEKDDPTGTGDTFHMVLYLSLIVLGLAALLFLLAMKKKKAHAAE